MRADEISRGIGINRSTLSKEPYSPEKVRKSPCSQGLCLLPKGYKVADRCRTSRGWVRVTLDNPLCPNQLPVT